MKLLFSFPILGSSVASALSLPLDSPGSVNHGSSDILTATGASSSSEVSLRFEAPCHGCFIGTDNGLVFDLSIYTATKSCGEGHVVVNGQNIKWFDSTAEGAGTFATHLTSGLGNRELNATWKASCIADEIQVFLFHILQVGQNLVKDDSGFTISFKQQGQPEVLHLAGAPLDISSLQDLAGQWTHPNETQRVTLASTAQDSHKSCLDDEFQQLQALKVQSHDLQKAIGEKKHKIHQLLRDDFAEFCSTIKKCESLKCFFRTTMHKLSEYARIAALHCGHNRPSQPAKALSKEDVASEAIRKQGDGAVMHSEAEASEYAEGSQHKLSQDSGVQHDELDQDSGVPHGELDQDWGVPHDELDLDSEVPHDELDQDWRPTASLNQHEYTPSLAATSQSRDQIPTSSSTPHHTSGYLPITPSSASHHHELHSSPRFGNHHTPRYHVSKYILPALVLLTILGGVAFLTLRRFKLICASPRERVSCSAAREERRNRRAYRRAARRHAWRNWWIKCRHPTSTDDYEEKRTLILEQEGVLEGAMQDEIRGLRVEQEPVEEMVRAEEGRSQLYHQANRPQHTHTNPAELEAVPSNYSPPPAPPLPSSSSSSAATFPTCNSRLQDYQHLMILEQQQQKRLMMARQEHDTIARVESGPSIHSQSSTQPHHLPSYRRSSSASSQSASSSLPPPRYEEELEGDIDVVDGFMYSPTFGRGHLRLHASEDGDPDDATPDSSVVDCSPRMSFDTGRTTLTSKTTTTIVR